MTSPILLGLEKDTEIVINTEVEKLLVAIEDGIAVTLKKYGERLTLKSIQCEPLVNLFS